MASPPASRPCACIARPARADDTPSTMRPDGLSAWIPTLCAVAAVTAAAGMVAWHTDRARRELTRHDLPGVTEPSPDAARTVIDTRVRRTLAALKLVTIEVHTQVSATVGDESWRGDSQATVSVPARLLYGCDLALARVERTGQGPHDQTLTVTLPPPQRLGSEVLTHQETADLRLGWLRMRSTAGERLLGLARRSLWHAAQGSALDPDHAQLVRAMARRQVAALVGLLLEHETAPDWLTPDWPDPPGTAPDPAGAAPDPAARVVVVFTDETLSP